MEVVRAASSFMGADAEITILESDRVFVVAGSDPDASNQPRSPRTSEQVLIDDLTRSTPVAIDGLVSVPIQERTSGAGPATVAALTIACSSSNTTCDDAEQPSLDGLVALVRLVERELEKGTAADTDYFEKLVHGQRDPVAVLGPDGNVAFISRGVGSLLGWSPSELIGMSPADIVHPDDIDAAFDAIIRVSQGLEVFRSTLRMRDSRNEYVPVEVTGTDLSEDPVVGGIVLTIRDAQRDLEHDRTLNRSQRMSDSIVENLRDGVVATDEFGTIVKINDTARSMFSINAATPPAQLRTEQFALFTVGGDLHDPFEKTSQTAADTTSPICSVVSRDGQTQFLTTSCEPITEETEDGTQVLGHVLVFNDITSEYEASEELRVQALHDQLTGLANRRQLDECLEQLTTSRPDMNVAACFIDLDGFKIVNDVHGHSKGDHLVRIAAARLSRQLRADDLLVRQGGDEFVALLVDVTDLQSAAETAERCRAALANPYILDGQRFDVTGSIGVAISRCDDLNPTELLRHADLALYSAKDLGRNRVELFDSKLATAVSREAKQRRRLKGALESRELAMYFQPLVDAEREITIGYEALARIKTVDGSLVTPDSFLESVSSTSLMWELDQTAFALSCDALAKLSTIDSPQKPFVSCNFSPISVSHPEFLPMLQYVVESTGVDPAQVSIELTESAAFDVAARGTSQFDDMVNLGFKLALDDFGTGYSSLSHLRDLPISSLKVDRSFITNFQASPSERSIAGAIVKLAHDLNFDVVAEGVETAEHLRCARELGFPTIQGWYYSPALSLDEAIEDWTLAAKKLVQHHAA